MIAVILFLLGLCLGSFVNALVWRLRQAETGGVKTKAKKRELSIIQGRSMCPRCQHILAPKDLIPVLSWLSLRGKCRYCHKPIEDNPLTELLTGLLFVISYVSWPQALHGIEWLYLGAWLSLVVLGVALAVYDLRYMRLPNKLIVVAGAIVLVYTLLKVLQTDISYLLDSLWGLVAFGGLFYVLFQVSDGKWIGGGDVKLGFVLGAWLADYRLSFLAIFIASLVGTLYVGWLALNKKVSWQARLPFGPLLLFGTFLATLYGQMLIDWYARFLLGP